MSPHFYNKDEELEAAVAAVDEILTRCGAGAPARRL
jgi:selenocysteine lyase/cysteine desulfurase